MARCGFDIRYSFPPKTVRSRARTSSTLRAKRVVVSLPQVTIQGEDAGWVRGKACGKPAAFTTGAWACVICDRISDDPAALCMPVPQRAGSSR